MKKKILAGLLIITLTALLVGPAQTQEIISVTPSSGFAGETAYPVIVCNNAQLLANFESIAIGDPSLVQVLSVEVKSNFELEVIIDISPLAAPDEFMDIIIYLNDGNSIQKEDAFLTKAVGDFEVMLTVIHVDPLYLSAFDPGDPQNSPLLFTVQLMNEWKDLENVRIEFIVENPDYGQLGNATKIFDTGIPKGLPYLVFDNRDFDEYEINSDALDLLDEAMQTGLLPPGVYNYYITVYANDSLIGQDEGINVTTNILTAIDLIGPGSPLGEQPTTIFSPTPYFQWFSSATSFDLALYEVMEGQYSPDEIISNLPEFEETGLGTTQLLYPGYAEILEPGKTYAWQVKAYFDGSMGLETIYSDVFWFQYQYQEGVGYELDYIEVGPEGSIVGINESNQYYAIGYDQFGNPEGIDPNWHVVPSSAGTIDENGNFTAGSEGGVAAVVASYGGLQEYTTALISETVPQDYEFGMASLANDMFCLHAQCENDVYISKQTGEYWPDCEGVGTKTTDRYEHGCVTITNEGPIFYGVIPNDFCIGKSTTKSWEGWGHPDVDMGPPPGESEPAMLKLDYDVHYSRPVEFLGGVEIPCGVIYSEVVEGGYSCSTCVFHEPAEIGFHDLIHKTGAITVNFNVHSLNINVPNVCFETGKSKTVFAETYPTDKGMVSWEPQSNEITIVAENRTATVTGNTPGIYPVTATLNVLGVTYKTEFTVTVCEVDLIDENPGAIGTLVGTEREKFTFKNYTAKVLPMGTEANVSVLFGDVELDKTLVKDGDKISVWMKPNEKYGLRITHECNDSIYKDIGKKSEVYVTITKSKYHVVLRANEVHFKCSASGSPKGGEYVWDINGLSATGKNVSVTLEACDWNYSEGDNIPIKVTYIKDGESAYDDELIKVNPLPSELEASGAIGLSRVNANMRIACHARAYPYGGVYSWEIRGKSYNGGNEPESIIDLYFKPHEWDYVNGEMIPVTATYIVCGDTLTKEFILQAIPRFKVEVTKKKIQGDVQSGDLTVECEAEAIPPGGNFKWDIGGKIAYGKTVSVLIDVCDWDYKNGQNIPIKVEYITTKGRTEAETSVYAKKLPYSYHFARCD